MKKQDTKQVSSTVSLADYLIALSAEARLRNEELMIKAASFNYAGFVTGVIDGKALVLEGAKYVFDTGDFDNSWADAQPVPSGKWHIMIDAIESFGIMR